MIIDFHSHYTQGRFLLEQPHDTLGVLRDMEANQIETSLLLPTDGFFTDPAPDNDFIMGLADRYPDRFVGTGTVNPRFPEQAVAEMKRCLAGRNMIGLKFHTWLQAFSPLQHFFIELAEEADRMKTMFFFHDGTPPYSEPLQIAEIARRFPNITVVLGHAGLNDLWRESLKAAETYDNIWLCFCCTPFWAMQEIAERMGGERIVWGSDYPMMTLRDTSSRIREVELLTVSDQVRENILYGNAKRLIGQLSNR
jgi:hypothetical protein